MSVIQSNSRKGLSSKFEFSKSMLKCFAVILEGFGIIEVKMFYNYLEDFGIIKVKMFCSYLAHERKKMSMH